MGNTESLETLEKSVLIERFIALQEELKKNQKELERNQAEIQRLKRILYKLQRSKYGNKSEKIEYVTRQLCLLGFEVDPKTEQETPKVITIPEHKRSTSRKAKDYSELPVERVVFDVEKRSCDTCNGELSVIGEDVSRELNYQPAKLFIKEFVRPKYACSCCKDKVTQAQLPLTVKPLERSIVGASLLAYIIVSKYVDHIPLHRLEEIFRRKGVELPRRAMCDWILEAVNRYLSPLHLALKKMLIEGTDYLHADETTIKIQDREIEGKCHTGYLWGMASTELKAVLFEYFPSRAGAVAEVIFKDFKGALQTDLYAGYNKVILPENGVKRLACLAHIRRKFIEVQKEAPKEASKVLLIIASMYKLEKQYAGLSPPERKEIRDKKIRPLLLELKDYLNQLSVKTLPKAGLRVAISYTLGQWDAVERILEDGRYNLDNNPIERLIRPIAVGRKNYLFAGSHEGAQRAAVIYSLLGTAKLNKINPYDWLVDVFTNMRGLSDQQAASRFLRPL